MKKPPKKANRMPAELNRRADFTVRHEGSLYLLEPQTEPATAWLKEHIHEDTQWFGHAVPIEHRYIGEIVQILTDEGFIVV